MQILTLIFIFVKLSWLVLEELISHAKVWFLLVVGHAAQQAAMCVVLAVCWARLCARFCRGLSSTEIPEISKLS